ncbi:MAG: XRE family transcriptional regulator [Salibacteraceae bacterium]
MNSTISKRLKSARLKKGFSLQELADALQNHVSRQSLHKYEQGDMIPDGITLNLLAVALGVKLDFFFRETSVELGAIEFRKLDRLPKKTEYKIVEEARDFLERYIELEEILGIEPEYENPLATNEPISSFEDIENAAAELRELWNMGTDPIANVAELLEDQHIKVVELDTDQDFDGLQTWVNGNIPVIAFNKVKLNKSDRIRFTLLHELAHLLLGDRFENVTHNKMEKLCHKFASCLLLPREAIIKELGENRNRVFIPELGNIKKQYGISIQAIVMLACDMEIVNPNYKKEFFRMMNQMNWRVDEPVSYDGAEGSHRFEQLVYRALAEDQISMNKAADLMNQKLAEFKRKSILV